MTSAVLLALLLVLVGCSPSISLEPRFAPLDAVREDPTHRLVNASMVTTEVDTVWVHDLAAWEAAYPAGSVAREALLLHERVHAVRQDSWPGPEVWTLRYLQDPAFRWEEEKLGWHEEILWNVQHGNGPGLVGIERLAGILANAYTAPVGGRMVGYNEALAWVTSEVNAALEGR